MDVTCQLVLFKVMDHQNHVTVPIPVLVAAIDITTTTAAANSFV